MKFRCGLYEIEVKARDMILDHGEEEDTKSLINHIAFIYLEAVSSLRAQGYDGVANIYLKEFEQLNDATKKGGESDV